MKELPKHHAIAYKAFFWLRINDLARFLNRTRVSILCYHGVTERLDFDPQDRSGISVQRALFRMHLAYLKQRYTVISLREYLTLRENGLALPRNSVILTFDDGLRNFLTVARPVLTELDLPAAVFLVTDRVEERNDVELSREWSASDDWISLSWAEVKALETPGKFEFGSHTCSHPELPQLSGNVERELHNSLRGMRENLEGQTLPSLAYPYGGYSLPITMAARSAGYACALSTDAGTNSKRTDLFRLRRTVIHRYDTIEIFAARVSGLVGWLRIARDFFRTLQLLPRRVLNSELSERPSA